MMYLSWSSQHTKKNAPHAEQIDELIHPTRDGVWRIFSSVCRSCTGWMYFGPTYWTIWMDLVGIRQKLDCVLRGDCNKTSRKRWVNSVSLGMFKSGLIPHSHQNLSM